MEHTLQRSGNDIDARPTKEFFITMLVKDFVLVDAIMDLVDNCVDGARRLRENGNFTDLWVRVEADENSFSIADNCGGIPLEVARDYAFRFGRPPGMPEGLHTPHSAGRFGVGMKRALFKLGRSFEIRSTTRHSRFVVNVDVGTWTADADEWSFRFDEVEEKEFAEEDTGTVITVSDLHPSVAADFVSATFERQLHDAIRDRQTVHIEVGLAITLNGIPVDFLELALLSSDELEPAYKDIEADPIHIRIYAGVAESFPAQAGWYVFCNGRLVLRADKSSITGWGEGGEEAVPGYHNQYARFRGYVFLDAERAEELPWNTTKTGLDLDAAAYRSVKLEMVRIMRPVIKFLNRLKKEKENPQHGEHGPLEEELEGAGQTRLKALQPVPLFRGPRALPGPRPPDTGRIQYDRPTQQIEWVKKKLGVRSNVKAGEGTFDYFLKMEGFR